jgi:hypothetical protein
VLGVKLMTRSKGARREEIEWEDRTTVMVRNIPSCYSQQELLVELDGRGWRGTYDFFYLPFDMTKKANMGYCFMNFKDPSLAEACHVALDGAQLARGKGRKRLQVVPAVTQGYEKNAEHFQHSAVLNHHRAEHGPVFLRDEEVEPPKRYLPRVDRMPPRQLQPPPPPRMLESLLPSAITTLALHPIPPGFSQPLMYVELCRIGVAYLVDFLHVDTGTRECVVNLTSPQAAVAASQVLNGLVLPGGVPLMVGIARVQGCGANILHYATRGILAEEAVHNGTSAPVPAPVPAAPVRAPLREPKPQKRTKSFEYTCPAFEQPAPQHPSTTASSEYTSEEDEPVEQDCAQEDAPQRAAELPSQFASLGISLETPEGEAPQVKKNRNGAAAKVTPTVTPPLSSRGGEGVPQKNRVADMERALHAGFPSLLSSPACNLHPSSRGSSSDSRVPRSATPPLSNCSSNLALSPQTAAGRDAAGARTPPAPSVVGLPTRS